MTTFIMLTMVAVSIGAIFAIPFYALTSNRVFRKWWKRYLSAVIFVLYGISILTEIPHYVEGLHVANIWALFFWVAQAGILAYLLFFMRRVETLRVDRSFRAFYKSTGDGEVKKAA